MALFTFQFCTGEEPFHHRFEVVAHSHEEAVEFLRGTDAFRNIGGLIPLAEGDQEKIALGLKTPKVSECPALIDFHIYTDRETRIGVSA